MKAIVVRAPGPPGVMQLEDVPDPCAGPREVVIQVAACGVTSHEVVVRNGTMRAGVRMPLIPGHEIAGTVVDVGCDVRTFAVGDRVATTQRYCVCGSCRFCRTGREPLCPERRFLGDWGMVGGYAEYVAVAADTIARVPDGVPLAAAATVASSIGTVLNAIREVGRLGVGETVLVTGAGGGLGVHAVQLCRLAGARVLAVTGSAAKAERLRALGAHEVLVADRAQPDFSGGVKDLTAGRGVDVVLDLVGTPVFTASLRSLDAGGRWILVGQLSGERVPFNPAQLFLRNLSMLSATSTTRKQLEDCLALVARGDIRPVLDDELPLSAAARAHERVERGEPFGRLLLRPNGDEPTNQPSIGGET